MYKERKIASLSNKRKRRNKHIRRPRERRSYGHYIFLQSTTYLHSRSYFSLLFLASLETTTERKYQTMNSPSINYALSKLAAARELARNPNSNNNYPLQDSICRKHGIFLESMTIDELEEFARIVEEFMGG